MYKIIPVGDFPNGPLTIYDWFKEKNSIEFEPKYQRPGFVWNKSEKQLLIDSIFNEFDIPKFYFHYNTNDNNPVANNSKKYFSIIDGKQRIHAIFEFMNNKWPLSDDFQFLNTNDIDIRGMYYKDIANSFPSVRTKFDKYKLDVVYVITDNISIVKTMFRRLNSGVSIKNPEIRRAISGFLSNHIENEINNNQFFKEYVYIKDKHGIHFDIYSKLLLIEYSLKISSSIPNLTKKNIDGLFFSNMESNPTIKDTITLVSDRLKMMCTVFRAQDPLLNRSGMILLYYLFLSRFVHENTGQLREFFLQFEELRKNNVTNITEHELLEFDRLNQQGSTRITSLLRRLDILSEYYRRSI